MYIFASQGFMGSGTLAIFIAKITGLGGGAEWTGRKALAKMCVIKECSDSFSIKYQVSTTKDLNLQCPVYRNSSFFSSLIQMHIKIYKFYFQNQR